MAWDPINDPCDYITLAKVKSPGIAEVRGAGSHRKWDELDALGHSIYKGRGVARFSVLLRLYDEQDWKDWQAWRHLVDKLPKRLGAVQEKDTGAMDIWHPLLEELDIKAVVVEDLIQADQTDHGEWTIEIKFLEFREPKIVRAKPEGSAATPVDPVEDLIIKPLINQLQSYADEQ
jgi:hypothetical protein